MRFLFGALIVLASLSADAWAGCDPSGVQTYGCPSECQRTGGSNCN